MTVSYETHRLDAGKTAHKLLSSKTHEAQHPFTGWNNHPFPASFGLYSKHTTLRDPLSCPAHPHTEVMVKAVPPKAGSC